MLTSVIDLNRTSPRATDGRHTRCETLRKVVIVNGGDEVLDMLASVLDGGQYEVTLIDAATHAYSHIRALQPHLVILCVRVDDADGLRVLSMLKLDVDTHAIPVLTFTIEDASSSEASRRTDRRATRSPNKPTSQMN